MLILFNRSLIINSLLTIIGSIMVKRKVNCLTCRHMKRMLRHAHFETTHYGVRGIVPTCETFYCERRYQNIQKLNRYCPYHYDLKQTELKGGIKENMKIHDVPTEMGRVELNDLPQIVDLRAVDEKIQVASEGKSGGLVITFELRDGRQFPQKYTKVSGAKLIEAMETLKITNTVQLQKAWYTYRLTIMRIGKPRMIPQEVALEQ